MVSPTDVQFIKTRFNVQSSTGQDYWNWTTIPKSGGGHRVEFDTATQTYKISYSFTSQDSDLTYFNDPTAVADGFGPYLLHRENADPALIATIEGILNPTGAYSVLFTDVSKIDFVQPAAGTRGLIDISSADNDTSDPSSPPPTGLAATYVDRTLPTAAGYNANKHGDIFLSHQYQTGASAGSEKYTNLVHEIGHTLGLKHPQIQPGGTDGPEGPYSDTYNSVKYTLMSYQPHPDMAANVLPTGLQLLDIAAIQSIYGRNYSIRGSSTTPTGYGRDGVSPSVGGFGADPNKAFIYTIWDGGGDNDTIFGLGYNAPVEIDLRQGHFSSIGRSGNGTAAVGFDAFDANGNLTNDKGNVAIAFHSIIENAAGTDISSQNITDKADVLIGNDWKNRLEGFDGNDWLFGNGVVYDGEHGFNSVTTDDPTDTSDSFGNLHDPNRTLPGLLNTDMDDDLLIPGYGKDQAFGGVGNDTFMADSDAAGNDLEGDYYHGGGYTGGGFDANRVVANLIPYATDGDDTLNYSNITNFGIDVKIESSEVGTAQRAGSTSGPQDTIISFENFILTNQADKFLMVGQADEVVKTVDGGLGIDTLDASGLSTRAILNIEISQNDGNADSQYIKNIENIKGTAASAGDIFRVGALGHTLDGGGGADTVNYEQLKSEILVTVDGNGNGSVVSKSNPAGPSDQLIGLKQIIGTLGNDEYKITGSGNLAISELKQFFYVAPIGPSLLITNEGRDKLDLSGLTGNLTVQIGGGKSTLNPTTFITDLTGGDASKVVVAFSDGTTLNASGIEEVTLREGNDRLITGNGPTVAQGTESVHTKVDMGEKTGDADIVEVWGSALLKNGTLYAESGTEVISFEEIDLSSYRSPFENSSNPALQTFRTLELGYKYTDNTDTANWLDYSGFGNALTFNLGGTGSVTDNLGATPKSDTLVGQYLNIVGSNNGDTFEINDRTGYILTGAGDDTINVHASTRSIYYTGGADIISGNNATVVMNGQSIPAGSISIQYLNPVRIYDGADVDIFAYDIKVTFAGGSITFDNGKLREVTSQGATFDFAAGDTLILKGIGEVDLDQAGVAHIIPVIGTPDTSWIKLTDFSAPVGTATSGADIIQGSFSSDTINGNAGADTLYGKFGNDVLNGGDGDDILKGGADNDTITGGIGDDLLSGDDGDDTLDGGAGFNYLAGGSGKDKFIINPGIGDDTILDYSRADGDIIKFTFASAQNAFTSERVGNDLVLHAGAVGSVENVIIKDFYSAPETKPVLVNFVNLDPEMFFDAAGNLVAAFTPTEGDDTFTGTNGVDVLSGLGGDDLIYGFDSADQINGGNGHDTLSGGGGGDTLTGGAGNDFLMGDAGNDLFVTSTADGNDTYDGGDGIDAVNYTAAGGVNFNVSASGVTATGANIGSDQLQNVETILTSTGNDTATVVAGATPVNLVYVGGDDIFNIASAVKPSISFGAGILASDIQPGAVTVNGSGQVTEALFTIAGHGTLTLRGDNLNTQTVQLPGGGEYAITPAGIAMALVGTAGNDTLAFSAAYPAYDGLAGTDTLDMSAITTNTNTSLQGGSGTVSGSSIGVNYLLSVENIVTGSGNDTVSLSDSGRVTYTGGTDVYTLSGSGSNVHVSIKDPIVAANVTVGSFVTSGGHVTSASFNVAGLGTLTLQGAELAGYTVDLSNGDQFVITATGIEPPSTFFGTNGNDILNPPNGFNKVSALGGDDLLVFHQGTTVYDGGAGTDTLDLSALTGAVSMNMGASPGATGTATGSFGSISLVNIENIVTGAGNDIITGNSGNNQFQPNGGADTINAGLGNDVIIGLPGSGNDLYNGGLNIDTVDYSAATQNISANLSTGVASSTEIGTDTLQSIESVKTGAGNDTITASASSGTFQGDGGNDIYNVSFTVTPVNPDPGPPGAATLRDVIIDQSGSNVLNITSAINNVTLGFGFGGIFTDLTLVAQTSTGQADFTRQITIKDWFNGGTYRPLTTINVLGPNGSTRVFTADQIDAQWKPTAKNDVFNAQNLLTVSGNVLANNGNGVDVSATAGTLNVTAQTITTSHGGTVHLNTDGTFTYTGATGYSGSDSFTYTVTDSRSLLTSVGTVNISNIFDQPNRPPTAVNDTFDAQGGIFVVGNVLTNDSDLDHNAISAPLQVITTANGGTASITENGNLSYQAADGFRGSDNFTYTVQDSLGAQSTATVTVNNIFSNASPVAMDDTVNANAQGLASGNVLLNDSDPDLDALTVLQNTVQTENGGAVTLLANGDFTYQAATGFIGNDSFEYFVQDEFGALSSATVHIAVGNLAPDAKDDLFSAQQAAAVSGNVLVNNGNGADSDPDGDSLSVVAQDFTTVNGNIVSLAANGNFSYQAVAGFRGSDSFSYTVTDGQGGSDTATVNIANIFTNRAPVAQDDQINALNGSFVAANVLANHGNGADSDPDGDTLSVIAQTITTANGGQVTLSANGDFNYQAAEGFRGSDSFNYTLQDAFGATDAGTVSISNIFTNRAPVAKTDLFSGDQDTEISGNVLANNGNGADSDPDGDTLTVAPQTLTTVQGGTVVLSQNGGFTYLPAAGFFGADSFTYALSDAFGASALGTVNLSVAQPSGNNAPDAKNDEFFGILCEDIISGNLLANNGFGVDTDADNDPLHVVESSIVTAQGRTVAISANGDFTYNPSDDFIGTDSFTYTLADNHGATDTATVSLHIETPSGALVGTSGANVLHGIDGDDYHIYGLAGNDTLKGGNGDDHICGGSGNDELDGKGGADFLSGGDGNDILRANSEDDILSGDAGNDTLYGGAGENFFVFHLDTAFSGIDSIVDFKKNQGDKLDISDLLTGFDQLSDSITDFVQIAQSPTNNHDFTLKVDMDGLGSAFAWQQIALFKDPVNTLTDEQALLNAGTLVVS